MTGAAPNLSALPVKPGRKTGAKPKAQRILLRVAKGCLVPADAFAAARLRAKGFKIGDELLAELRKPRNPKYWRLGHALGQLLIQNATEFEHYTDPHAVIKRLQLESGIACDSIALRGEFGMVEHRTPRSLSFADMDDGTWTETYAGLCNWVRKKYWPDLTDEQVAETAELMPAEAA